MKAPNLATNIRNGSGGSTLLHSGTISASGAHCHSRMQGKRATSRYRTLRSEGSQLGNKYSQWIWRQYASAFWDDIRIWRTLPFKNAREEGDEQVPHPLQLDVIERALALWSNPGETVLTPFMGVGSEVCAALVNGYRAIGIELKTGYFNQSKRNIAYYLEHGFGELESTHHQFAEEETEEIPQATLYE